LLHRCLSEDSHQTGLQRSAALGEKKLRACLCRRREEGKQIACGQQRPFQPNMQVEESMASGNTDITLAKSTFVVNPNGCEGVPVGTTTQEFGIRANARHVGTLETSNNARHRLRRNPR
jgi:hypothetical protein